MTKEDNFQVLCSNESEFKILFNLAELLDFNTSLSSFRYPFLVFYFDTKYLNGNFMFRPDTKENTNRGPQKPYKEAVQFLESLLGYTQKKSLEQKECTCEMITIFWHGCLCGRL